MTAVDMRIVVPSRRRAHNMEALRKLVPTASICVEDSEADDYTAAGVPKDHLILHPPLAGIAAVRTWMVDNVKNDIIFQLDDDLTGVRTLVGKIRKVTDPDFILAIIENAAQAAVDLDLGVFCFGCVMNPAMVKPDFRPIRPVQPVFAAFGVRGASKRRRWNSSMNGREDTDWTLRTLLEDRLVYADVRFAFDFGRAFTGRGGNVGLLDDRLFKQATANIKRTWGPFVEFDKPPMFGKPGKRDSSAVSIRVSRTSPLAQR